MKNVLIVVDVQNDFVNGSLGTKEAEAIIPYVCKLIDDPSFDTIVITKDTHGTDYLTTREGKYLPVNHCIKGSDGWQIHPEVAEHLQQRRDICTMIEKPTFGSEDLTALMKKEKIYVRHQSRTIYPG